MDVFLTGFPKRLLVATSVVIIIAMCLIPAEARSVEHRRRHQKRQPETMAQLTKELSSMKRPKNPSIELYKNATRKINKKLRNTKRFFDQKRRILNETKEYGDGKPEWLPTFSFVDVHFHDYKSARKGASITERKFTYIMPKLYKSLKEYEVIFTRLKNVKVEFPDNPFNNYKILRDQLIADTLQRLISTIAEISENMYSVNAKIPPFEESRMKLDSLEMKVDATQCLKNDYIAFRGYGNLLNNWYLVFRCPRNKRNTKRCIDFEHKLEMKRGYRRQKNNKPKSLMS
ncbi:uncharacterized protein [Epargyreus clarus]|uniref:uncharacterized protein isoform X2 n=1 Tax=Epargyreus clarus TaxID=520877 RepID=UPI003C308280